jgi:Rhodopirellula transposase DDE domain
LGWIFVGGGIPSGIARLYRAGVIDESAIRQRFEALAPVLDERCRRRFAAAEAAAAGHGGVVAVMRATGIARSTIGRGLAELRVGERPDAERVRRPGGGCKPASETDASLLDDLRSLVEPETRGDPQSPLLWTCKSLRKLSQSLRDMGHTIGRTLVGELLHKLDYRLQANRKTREGSHNPDRDAQFRYINDRVKEALAAGEPAISVDTKKKELVGDFKNAGREWRPKGSPEEVRVHDFVIPELGRAAPYGVYDIAGNVGWVSVGIDHDTAAFAANAIRSWWKLMGRERYPNASSLLITADGGGSNGSRVRLWKTELQKLADELGVPVTVCHLPPGTSKWNKRAPPVLVHHHQLARQTARQPSGHRPVDRRNDHEDRPEGSLRTRSKHLSGRHQGVRRRNGCRQPYPPPLPRRVELHRQPKSPRHGAIAPGRGLR